MRTLFSCLLAGEFMKQSLHNTLFTNLVDCFVNSLIKRQKKKKRNVCLEWGNAEIKTISLLPKQVCMHDLYFLHFLFLTFHEGEGEGENFRGEAAREKNTAKNNRLVSSNHIYLESYCSIHYFIEPLLRLLENRCLFNYEK